MQEVIDPAGKVMYEVSDEFYNQQKHVCDALFSAQNHTLIEADVKKLLDFRYDLTHFRPACEESNGSRRVFAPLTEEF